jgi:hypothetical protein
MTALWGRKSKNWTSFIIQNTSLHALLAFNFLLGNLLLLWWVYLFMFFDFSLLLSLTDFNILSLFFVNIFIYNMLWRISIWSYMFSVLETSLYELWYIFCYYFLSYVSFTFSLHIFFCLISMICMFGVLWELQSSCIFLSQCFSLFSVFFFFIEYLFCLQVLKFCLLLVPVC